MTELDLFNFIKDTYISDLEPTGQYDNSDAYSKKYNLNIELKCRLTHYEDLLIERYKWDKLKAMPGSRYINYTPRGIYSFNIEDLEEPFWQDMKMPRTTEFKNRDKINKQVGFISILDAKKIG